MKPRLNAKANIVNVLNLSSVVRMASVFRRDGDAIMKTVNITLHKFHAIHISRFNLINLSIFTHFLNHFRLR